MKEILTLAAQPREDSGTRHARRIRQAGRVPCIVYGHKQAPAPVTVEGRELEAAVRHHTRMIDLEVGGAKQRVLINEVQYDTFGTAIIHVDFLRVAMDEVIRVSVPIELRGHAKGEQHGGVTEQLLTEVAIECLPGNLPESIPLVVTDLEVGDSVHVSDLKPPPGIKITSSKTLLVVTVAVARAALAAEDEAPGEAAEAEEEPQVIARGKGEEDQATDQDKAS
ncbi:MAG: 50S ribosomal protein L25 [Anaerolineaceae bacterium]|nr:50S ribosomal protein L25 [Anaerolineaceae bacterium]